MQSKNIQSFYGIKWNPFDKSIPIEGMVENKEQELFSWRMENLVMDGGYAIITGQPGTGKSVKLRLLEKRLSSIQELKIASIDRPQSSLADFYRELGELFEIDLKSNNRWRGFKDLREKWNIHIKNTMFRSVLIIDECQEMPIQTLNEIRLLSSTNFDSKVILTIILCGDDRLLDKLKDETLLPFFSRINVKLNVVQNTKQEMFDIIIEIIKKAGNPQLLTNELAHILADHSMGNMRAMMTMANELLMEGFRKEVVQLNEQLFFEKFKPKKHTTKNTKN